MTTVANNGPHGSIKLHIDSRPTIVVCDPRLSVGVKDAICQAVSRAQRESTVWVATSGSTRTSIGLPRLVALSWEALCASANAVNQHLQVRAEDRWLSALPDFHVGGLAIHVRACAAGCEPVFRSAGNESAWNPNRYIDDLRRTRATFSALVPTQLFDLVRGAYSAPSTLRAVVLGGQALAPELFRSARRLGWPVLPSYGMTEACSQVATATLASLAVPEFPVLRALSHMQVRVDEQDMLWIQSGALLDGYIEWDHAGVGTFVDPKIDGWLRTSDRARIEGSGEAPITLSILGRSGGAIKIGGELVERQWLENQLVAAQLEIGEAFDAALVFQPDERLGQVVELQVVDAAQGERLAALFNERVPAAGRARRVTVVPAIERTAIGKLRAT